MSKQQLCISPRCWTGQSGDPHLAADGLYLCIRCTTNIATDARSAAELHAELALVLSASGRPGETPPPNKPGSREPNDAAVVARATISHVLASWCKLISEERGMHLPRQRCEEILPDGIQGPPQRFWRVIDEPSRMADYIAKHAEWLAAQHFADEVSDELAELAHGKPRSVAYPSGGRRWQLKDPTGAAVPCPDPECSGTLWAILRRADSLLPSELACDVDAEHHLPATHWLEYGHNLHKEKA